jgi:plastocyanin
MAEGGILRRRNGVLVALAGASGALVPLAWPSSAVPHAGHPPAVITIADLQYQPSTVTIYTGDTVAWTWAGPDTNHSVTSDDGSAQAFDSDPGKTSDQVNHAVGDGFSVIFNKVGTYSFHCKVHSFMTGTITVQDLPGGLPPPTPPPAITALTAKPTRLCDRRSRHCAHPGTLLRFTLTQPGDLIATVRRLGGTKPVGRVLKEVDFGAPPGPGTRRVDFGRLAPGPYRIKLVAVDRATGKTSTPRTVDVEVRR